MNSSQDALFMFRKEKTHGLEYNERCSGFIEADDNKALPVCLCGQEGSPWVTPEHWSAIGQRRM